MDISTFVTKKKREMSLMKKFYSVAAKTKSKEELRELELQLLRPKPIQKYTGPTVGRKDFAKRCIRLTFPKKEWIRRWMKMFRVNSYVEYNTWDIDFIMELLVKLESGRLIWSKKRKCYYLKTRDGRKVRI